MKMTRNMLLTVRLKAWGWGFSLLTLLALNSYFATAQGRITLSTQQAIGSTLDLKMEVAPGTEVVREGIGVDNVITAQEITLTGDFVKFTVNTSRVTTLKANCPNLKELDVSFNELSELDLTNLPNLEFLGCFANNIEELNIESCPKITRLSCGYNGMKKVHVGSNPLMRYVSCHTNDFDGSAFESLYQSLPDLSAIEEEEQRGQIILINAEHEKENNQLTDPILAEFQKKGWRTYQVIESQIYPIDPLNKDSFIGLTTSVAVGETVGLELVPKEGSPILIEGLELLDSYPSHEGWAEYKVTSQDIKIFGEIETVLLQKDDNFSLSKIDVSTMKSLVIFEVWGGAHSFSSLDFTNLEKIQKVRVASVPSLEKISVQRCPLLEDLNIQASSLSSVTIAECPNLNFVSCFENKIKLDNMKKLVSSLPERGADEKYRHFYMVNSLAGADNEQNEYNNEVLKILRGKNWIPFDWKNGEGADEENDILGGVPIAVEKPSAPSLERVLIANGELRVEEVLPGTVFTLYDASGKVIASAFTSSEGVVRFDVSNLPYGTYVVASPHYSTKITI